MNFNFYALRAIFLILVTSFLTNIANATSPDYPEIDEELGKLLIDGMGDLMNDYPEETDPDYPTFTDEHYRARFLEMSGAIQYRLTPDIKNHIIHRTERYRSSTERTLGLSEMYFPIFEEYLAEKNIPHHLKYLPIVESNLNAVAKSHAAAVGLWQFIPGTGKLYGLKVVSYLDERSDTHKASHAAATMLSNLFKRYNDWPLALAAYNCGPGRVDKYVKGNNKDFWDIRKYLPRETQMYVPYFMAVAYSYEYHHLHELTAKRLPSDLVLTDSIHLAPGYKTLSQLSKKYKISLDTLKRLNPGYIKNYIPSGSKLSILVLPARIVAGLRNYAPAWNRIMSMKSENPIKCIRRVNNEGDLAKLMKAHRFSRNDLLFWNGLPSNYSVQRGDIVAVRRYRVPKDALPKKVIRQDVQGISIASLKVVGLDDKQEKAVTAPVYVSIKNKKLAQKLSTNSINPSNRKERPNLGIVSTRTNPRKPKTATLPTKESEVIANISENRSRGRRLRNNTKTSTVQIQNSTSPTVTNTTTEETTANTKAKTESATQRVTELSRSIQSKEQAIVKAKTYNTTSVEEVTTLSHLNSESEELKKVRMTKKKDSETKLANEAAKLEAEEKAKAFAAKEAAKLEAEEKAKVAAAKEVAKLEAEERAKVAAAKEATKLEAEERAKVAAAKEAAKLEAEEKAKAAAAKEAAKLEAEEKAKAAAAKEAAKLEAEEKAKVAAAKEAAKLEAEEKAKAAAAKEAAKLEAEERAKAAAAKEAAKLEAEERAKAAAAKEAAKLEAEEKAKAAVAKEAAKLEAEEKAKVAAAKAAAKLEAEEKAKVATAKLEAEEKAKVAAAKAAAKLEAEEKAKAAAAKAAAKLEAEEKAKAAAAKEAAKLEAEEKAKAAAAKEAAKLEAEEKAKAAAKEAAKLEAEEKAKAAAAKEAAKLEAEEKAKAAAKEQVTLEAEKERLANTYQYHQVKSNETIFDIAEKHKVSVMALRTLNDITGETTIRKGMELKIRKK